MGKKLFYLIIGCMVLMLSACGGKSNDAAAVSKEYVYRAEELVLDGMETADSVRNLTIKDGRIYVQCNTWNETENVITMISQNADGSDTKSIEIRAGNERSYYWFTPTEDGSFYGICEEYFEDNSDPENYIWRNDYYLIKLDADGTEVLKKQIKGKVGEEYWIQGMLLMPDGRIVISDSQGISLYDGEGNKIKDVEIEREIDESSLYLLEDGSLLLNRYDPEIDRNTMCKLNIDTGELSEDYVLPGGSDSYTIYPGKGCDLLLVGSSGVYAYNLGDETIKKRMDYIDSDVNASYIYNLAAISENEFYAMMEEPTEGNTVLMKFMKVKPEDVVDKEVLTLACNGLDWDVRNRVVEFNKTNEVYRVHIEDYSEYNTYDDYTVGTTRLNTDIVSGKIPDILILDWQMPVESYIAKGLFEDLYPYIEKDLEFSKEDFFPNVLKAYENNGKLYRIVPRFTIYTVAGKTADVGEEPGWTMDELNQLMASKPEDMEIFTESTRSSILQYGIELTGNQFIDWETGECHFNSKEFIQLLEFAERFPEEIGEEYYSDDYWMNYEGMWRDEKVLLQRMYLDSFANYNYAKKATFGEDITLIGFPTNKGNGAAISAHLEMVMSSKSENKEGAWEFIRYFLTDEYQSQIDYGWPLSMKQIDTLVKEAQRKPYYEDENGEIIEYESTYYMNGMEMPLELITQEEAEEVLAYVKSVEQVHAYNEKLLNIVEEEAAAYFAGQKNAEAVADIIQSRAQIYVNENR